MALQKSQKQKRRKDEISWSGIDKVKWLFHIHASPFKAILILTICIPLAALKCRQRKKAWLAQLQAQVEFLKNENERLTSALVSSREEISRLNALLGGAAGPGVSGAASVSGVTGVGQVQPVSVSVSLAPPGKSLAAQMDNSSTAGGGPGVGGAPPVSVVNGRGYGY